MATVVYTLPHLVGVVKVGLFDQGLPDTEVRANSWLPQEHSIIVMEEQPSVLGTPFISLSSHKPPEPKPVDQRVVDALKRIFSRDDAKELG
jgi:hypothetical protein